MTLGFLLLCAASVPLGAYAVGHYAMLLAYLRSKAPKDSPSTAAPPDLRRVAVLVPARNEGAGAVRALRSILAQDTPAPVDAWLLIASPTDTAWPHLEAAFGPFTPTGDRAVLVDDGHRRAFVACTGADAKTSKIAWALERIDTERTAILDADHEAHPGWLRSATNVLRASEARAVQGRREPIAAAGLFGLWDSLHQHVGCEVANGAWSALGLPVFFTGTTAVFATDALREVPLRPGLTEDTDWSYRWRAAGHAIAYDPYGGSREEVSPNLTSFIARRRRWANGHTEAFLRAAPALLRAPMRLRGRMQLLFHGFHYLIAVPLALVHALVGALAAQTLPAVALGTAAGLAIAGAVLITARQGRPALAPALAVAAWLGPTLTLLIRVGASVLGGEMWTLPLPPALLAAGLAAWAAPLAVLLAGMARTGQMGMGSFLAVIFTYPVALVLDVAAVLAGLADLVTGRRVWTSIARAPEVEAVTLRESWRMRNIAAGLVAAMARPGRLLAATAVLAVLAGAAWIARGPRDLPIAARPCTVLEHDGHPWIVPPSEVEAYCGEHIQRRGHRTGSFAPIAPLHPARDLERQHNTFPCNEAIFWPDNAVVDGSGATLTLTPTAREGKAFSAGAFGSVANDLVYGRYEATLQVPRASGTITALFLYRFDPWQEIDLEVLGQDPTKLLANVYYNPGKPGDLYNYGYRGTPVLIDLGFDASAAAHTYAIEWDPGEIRWFVDDQLVHARPDGAPTPIPHLPMRLFVNLWPNCSAELVGPIDPTALPATARIGGIGVGPWQPPNPLFGPSAALGTGAEWRKSAKWMQ